MADKSAGQEEGVNVQVLLRCRPLSDKEQAERTPVVVTCNEALREVTLFQNTAGKSSSKTYRFDKVFGCDSTQEKLFKQAVVPIVHEVMDGFNCTIFAYGQTGTGKTYTMEGGPRESDDGRKLSAQAGVIPRSIKQIFDHIEASNTDSTVKVSFLELYNEELTDLLSFDDADSKKLRLLEDRSGVVVQGLEEVIVRSATEIYQVLDRGTAKRRTAATLLNQRSSRSHSIFTITIHMKETTAEGEDVIKIGKLNLVDLAGSENISRSGAKDNRAREAGSINQSLLTLGRVITALVEHSGHVPYRDSKLTRLLRDSLGGRTKTCIIATIAPVGHCMDETISTLDYAHRAKNIRNRPELNQKISKTTMIKELAAEIEKLKLDLQCTREKNGVYLSSERYEQGELERVQLRESVKALRAELEQSETQATAALEAAQTQHAQQMARLQAQLQARTDELTATRDELEAANNTLQERAFVTATLRRAEQSLAAFAEKLTQELTLCSSDINDLNNHIQQVSGLQANDRRCLQHTQQLISTRLRDMSDTLSASLSGQSQYLAAISQDVASFTAQKQKDVTQLSAKLTAIQASVDSLQGLALQRLQAAAATADGQYKQLDEGVRAYGKQTEAACAAAAAAAEGALGAVVQALQAETVALEAMARTQVEQGKESERRIAELTTFVQDGFTSAATAASEVAAAQEASVTEIEKRMQDLSSSLESSMQQQQGELMTRITELVQSFASSRTAAMEAGLKQLKEAVSDSSRSNQQRAQGLAAAAGQAKDKTQELGARLAEQMQQSVRQLQQTAGSRHAAVTAAGTAAVAYKTEATQHWQAAKDSADAHAKAISVAIVTAQQQSVQSVSQSGKEIQAAGQALAQARVEVSQTVQSQYDESLVFANAVTQNAEDAKQALASAGRGLESEMGQLAKDVTQGVSATLSVAPPAAPTDRPRPPVRPISAIQELMCPPEEVVLAQLRNTKKEITKRGGDARQAGALLLSPVVALRPATSTSPPSPRTGMSVASTVPGTPPSQQAPAAAGPVRSRIPGFPAGKFADASPSKAAQVQRAAGNAALLDKTNC